MYKQRISLIIISVLGIVAFFLPWAFGLSGLDFTQGFEYEGYRGQGVEFLILIPIFYVLMLVASIHGERKSRFSKTKLAFLIILIVLIPVFLLLTPIGIKGFAFAEAGLYATYALSVLNLLLLVILR